jgi:hypothetical protein
MQITGLKTLNLVTINFFLKRVLKSLNNKDFVIA